MGGENGGENPIVFVGASDAIRKPSTIRGEDGFANPELVVASIAVERKRRPDIVKLFHTIAGKNDWDKPTEERYLDERLGLHERAKRKANSFWKHVEEHSAFGKKLFGAHEDRTHGDHGFSHTRRQSDIQRILAILSPDMRDQENEEYKKAAELVTRAFELFPDGHDAFQLIATYANLHKDSPDQKLINTKKYHGEFAAAQLLTLMDSYVKATGLPEAQVRETFGVAAIMMIVHDDPTTAMRRLSGTVHAGEISNFPTFFHRMNPVIWIFLPFLPISCFHFASTAC